jgi:hypothetical protein
MWRIGRLAAMASYTLPVENQTSLDGGTERYGSMREMVFRNG